MNVFNATPELPERVQTNKNNLNFNQNTWYCITGPAILYQFVCYTISVGCHFPPKSNDDCLPWLLFPSFFYDCNGQTAQNYLSPVMLWLQFTCESLNKYRYALLVSKIFTSEVCEAACGGEGTRDKDDSN